MNFYCSKRDCMDNVVYMHPTTWNYIIETSKIQEMGNTSTEPQYNFFMGTQVILSNFMKPTIYEHWVYPNTFLSKKLRKLFRLISKITKKNERYYCEKFGIGYKQEFVLGEIWGPSPITYIGKN